MAKAWPLSRATFSITRGHFSGPCGEGVQTYKYSYVYVPKWEVQMCVLVQVCVVFYCCQPTCCMARALLNKYIRRRAPRTHLSFSQEYGELFRMREVTNSMWRGWSQTGTDRGTEGRSVGGEEGADGQGWHRAKESWCKRNQEGDERLKKRWRFGIKSSGWRQRKNKSPSWHCVWRVKGWWEDRDHFMSLILILISL